MKKIGVFTGNRAEYGLLLPILKEIEAASDMELMLFVSGAHLDPTYGNTIEMINADGFHVTDKIQIDKNQYENNVSTSMAIGNGIISITESLKKNRPDLFVVYADRFEGFAATIAASQMDIPVVHIEGGDITEGGALDDSVRHAMTKLSHIHLTTNEQAMQNVMAMGEEKWRVFNIGLPSLDLIVQGKFASKDEIKDKWEWIDFNAPIVVFTQHSVTTEYQDARLQIDQSISALEELSSIGYQVFITYPNNDVGSTEIIEQILKLKKKNLKNIFITPSLGGYFYHGLISLAKNASHKVVCVGNSSSGIKETAIFNCPVVNIGTRQNGRLRDINVIDTIYDKESIKRSIVYCIEDEGYRKRLLETKSLYGDGKAAKKTLDAFRSIKVNKELIQKKHLF